MRPEDEAWMRAALDEARVAAARGEVPVGCVLVSADGRRIAGAHNLRETLHDPTAHAELVALRWAAMDSRAWRLSGVTAYVTLEPCAQCAGAAVLAKVGRVVYGATDPKAGMAGSVGELLRHPALNHRPEVLGGVLAEECGALLESFFAARR